MPQELSAVQRCTSVISAGTFIPAHRRQSASRPPCCQLPAVPSGLPRRPCDAARRLLEPIPPVARRERGWDRELIPHPHHSNPNPAADQRLILHCHCSQRRSHSLSWIHPNHGKIPILQQQFPITSRRLIMTALRILEVPVMVEAGDV